MKKCLSWLLVTLLLLGALPALAAEAPLTQGLNQGGTTQLFAFTPVVDTIGVQPGTAITIGSTTAMAGYFSTEMWGTNTADMDVRALIHGYSTVAWTQTLGMALDSNVVAGVEVIDNEQSRTYTITLMQDLTYNDGTPITARDYVFSLLLSGAPQVAGIGGTPRGLGHIVGFSAYRAGETNVLAGVRLRSEYSFSLEITGEQLPYFYGLAMLNATPYPLSVIAPGCEIRDDGNGAYIAAAADAGTLDATLGYTPGEFSTDMLAVTMLDPDTGYVYNPRVTCGPYMLESYDRAANRAVFTLNTRYKGNYEGQRPHVERITFEHVTNDTAMTKLSSGEINLVNKVGQYTAIAEGMALSGENSAQVETYPRSGFAFIAFSCEQGPTASVAVRNAIARCIDKVSFVNNYVGANYGLPVYGYYGVGQWMINQRFDADPVTGQPELDMTIALEELSVTLDVDGAKKLLVDDGWTLNASGAAFVDGVDDIRYRKVDAGLEPLLIKWAKTADSPIADGIEASLAAPFKTLGIGLEITVLPFNDVLSHYYRQKERTYDMFYLASNFIYVFDPYYDYHTDDAYQGLVNTSGLRDEEMMRLALDMRQTNPKDLRGYVEKWMNFQRRWVEQMPMVPLYSNIYFDFYATDIRDYFITEQSGWSLAIPYVWIGEPEPTDTTGEGIVVQG